MRLLLSVTLSLCCSPVLAQQARADKKPVSPSAPTGTPSQATSAKGAAAQPPGLVSADATASTDGPENEKKGPAEASGSAQTAPLSVEEGVDDASRAVATPDKRLLVLDVADKGVGKELSQKLGDMLAIQARKSFVGDIVTRTQLQTLLDDAALAASSGCDGDDCMADLAQKVDAGRVIAGTATRNGTELLLTVLVLEAQTGKLLSTEQTRSPDAPELYAFAMRHLTSKALTGRAADPLVPVRISVAADDVGARVFVDGRDAGEAPQLVQVLPGEHEVRVTLPGYEPSTQVITVNEGKPVALNVSMYWERFPLWPVAATLAATSITSFALGTALFIVGWYNYDGMAAIGAPFGAEHSYVGHTPGTTTTLLATSQNVLLWSWSGSALVTLALVGGMAAVAFEVGDLALLALQSRQGAE